MKNWTKSFTPATWAALVALVLIGLYNVIAPAPSGATKGKQVPVAQLKRQGQDLRKELDVAKGRLSKRTWVGAEDEIAPKAMALVSASARKNFVSVSAFRPQRTTRVDGVAQLNYLVAIEGGYPEVVNFLRSFENADSTIAVKAVQMINSDGATDHVRASVSLVAYRVEDSNGV